MFKFLSSKKSANEPPKSKILWLDLGDLGDLVNPNGPHEQWQDHGLGLLRTILQNNGISTDLLSTRAFTAWDDLRQSLRGYEIMIMNVRSYTFPVAYRSAKLFKEVNPTGMVLTGGMHATVALDEMAAIETPGSWFLIGQVVALIALAILAHVTFDMPYWQSVVAVVLSFALALVACRVTGETDTTPVGDGRLGLAGARGDVPRRLR